MCERGEKQLGKTGKTSYTGGSKISVYERKTGDIPKIEIGVYLMETGSLPNEDKQSIRGMQAVYKNKTSSLQGEDRTSTSGRWKTSSTSSRPEKKHESSKRRQALYHSKKREFTRVRKGVYQNKTCSLPEAERRVYLIKTESLP